MRTIGGRRRGSKLRRGDPRGQVEPRREEVPHHERERNLYVAGGCTRVEGPALRADLHGWGIRPDRAGAFTENEPLNPSNPYSASKAATDPLARPYWITHHLPLIIARSSNICGPYQYPERVIPLFTTNALEGRPLPLYGGGRNVCGWLFVLGNCAAIDLVLRKGKDGEIYNLGGGNESENVVLTRQSLQQLGKPETLIQPVKDRPGHDRRYALHSGKVRALGWKPTRPFAEALAETVNWHRTHEAWWRPLKSGDFKAYYEKQYSAR